MSSNNHGNRYFINEVRLYQTPNLLEHYGDKLTISDGRGSSFDSSSSTSVGDNTSIKNLVTNFDKRASRKAQGGTAMKNDPDNVDVNIQSCYSVLKTEL